jgi:hypothetical protein
MVEAETPHVLRIFLPIFRNPIYTFGILLEHDISLHVYHYISPLDRQYPLDVGVAAHYCAYHSPYTRKTALPRCQRSTTAHMLC